MISGIVLGILFSGPIIGIIGIFIREVDGFAVMAIGFWTGIFGAIIGSVFSMRQWFMKKNASDQSRDHR
jgi:hypothetical protein